MSANLKKEKKHLRPSKSKSSCLVRQIFGNKGELLSCLFVDIVYIFIKLLLFSLNIFYLHKSCKWIGHKL